ncbi:MAG: TrmO family methyltransferase domain-containing protein, partial [Bacteroidales bacterium]
MIQIEPIGHIVNDFDSSTSPELIKECISRICLNDQFAEGLDGIEKCEFLDVYYFLDRASDVTLTVKLRNGEERGVFATRSPNRPNHLAHTTVKFLKRDKNILWVTGLDALNNSPVL